MPFRKLMHALLIVGAAALGSAWAQPAVAQKKAQEKQPRDKRAPDKRPTIDVDAIRKELVSGDEKRIAAALERVRDAGEEARPLASEVEALLKKGVSVTLCVGALDAIGAIKQTSASALIAPYVRHRVPDVRRAAARALVKTGGAPAIRALRQALRSNDAVVRGVAASGLGELGAKEALPELFTALDRRVGEAAGSIGRLCDPTQCENFAERLGRLPFDVMTSGFDEILFRAPAEMPDDQKIRIVGRLRELGTKDAGAYLADVAQRWPPGWSARVKQAIDAAVKATGAAQNKEQK
jgi:HEAT repeat protein